ncbi:hypothetical protein LI951_05360 [Enterococcus sp. BWT-B8]|uniref:pectate lyase-like adhesive domain-containing protein n=1 Tax=Enterococcus sp. BWT-B8 TaxID=2885157 RepID=UPI001E391A36|nr:pectate lyase-like adhesive domain-containing protein [Enterococcus sp. BWT-B8]MCB5951486.1 hypothetical protein [Enterococcus sp. BWT-B8]
MKKITRLLGVVTFVLAIGYIYGAETPIEAENSGFSPIPIESKVPISMERTAIEHVQADEESNLFTGEMAMVSTMDEFKEAVSRSEVSIISVQENLVGSSASKMAINRSLLILGNDHTLDFTNNDFFFQLEEVTEPSVFRMENATITKNGMFLWVLSSVEDSENWTLELEDIQEAGWYGKQLASLPQGVVRFTGGVSNFTQPSSTTFIESKEIFVSNNAEVVINRDSTIFFSSDATIASPKVIIEEGAFVSITASGPENVIDLRGDDSEILIQNDAFLTINSAGTNSAAGMKSAIALVGAKPKVSVLSGGSLVISSTNNKLGISLNGEGPEIQVDDGNMSIDSTVTSIYLNGKEPKIIAQDSNIIVKSTSSHIKDSGIFLTGDDSQFLLTNSILDMKLVSCQGITMGGTAPEMKLNNSEITIDTDISISLEFGEINLVGSDPALLLENKSKINIDSTGSNTNILVKGNNPTLKLSNESGITINVASEYDRGNNAAAIRVSGPSPYLDISDNSIFDINITSGKKKGLEISGADSDISIVASELIIKTAEQQSMALHVAGLREVILDNGNALIKDSKIHTPTGHIWLAVGETLAIDNSEIITPMLTYTSKDTTIKNHSYLKLHQDDANNGDPWNSFNAVLLSIKGGALNIQTNSVVDIHKTSKSMAGTVNMNAGIYFNEPGIVTVESGGKLSVYNKGQGGPRDAFGNAGVVINQVATDVRCGLIVKDPDSEIKIYSENGAAVSYLHAHNSLNVEIEVSNYGSFEARGNTATEYSGIFEFGYMTVILDSPSFFDFRNDSQGGGRVFSTGTNSQLTGINSDLALWKSRSDLDGDPYLSFNTLDFQFSGPNFSTLVSTSNEEELNTSTIGTTGLQDYARVSSGNAVDIEESVLTVAFVNEENQMMPGYTLTIGEGQTIDTALNVGDVIDLTGSEFQAVQDQLTALETAGYEISMRPENETNFSITETAQTVTYKVTGQLFLKSAPSTVDFGSITYNAKVQRVDNPSTDGDLVVTDTRANQAAGWTLYAALTTNMKNDETGSVMNEALWYVDSAGEEISLTLDSGNQPIYTNASGGTFDVTGTWGDTSADPGLKLVADPTKTTVSSIGTYSGVVTWTIMAEQP